MPFNFEDNILNVLNILCEFKAFRSIIGDLNIAKI